MATSVRPLPVVVTVGVLAVLLAATAAVFTRRFGVGVPVTWVGILCLVAGFWMTRAASMLAGIGFAAACGIAVAVMVVLTGGRLGGTAPVETLVGLAVGNAVFGAIAGFLGGCAALVVRRLRAV